MARPVGLAKTGGRQAGTPNKKTELITQTLESFGHDLPQMIFDLLPTLQPEKQVSVLLSLMSYVYPKRQSISIGSIHEIVPPPPPNPHANETRKERIERLKQGYQELLYIEETECYEGTET